MIVRCGRCGNQFDVPGAGRFACPSCGTSNQVGDVAGPMEPAGSAGPGPGTMPPVPEPEGPPPQRVECRECGHSFFVGDVDEAPCPNCRATIEIDQREAS